MLVVGTQATAADELIVGLGIDDVLREDGRTAALGVEYRFEPHWTLGPARLGFGIAAEIDGREDFWGAGGIVLTLPVTAALRLHASLMPGFYGHGTGNDLGASAPMFRSQVGGSVAVGPRWRVGLAFNHKSNAGTSNENPGVETLLLTFGRSL
jgi:hypothetical protein